MPAKTSDVDLPIVTFGEFRVDFHLRCLNRGTEKVKIGPMAFNVLEFLVKNRHRVVSKDELLKNVWGEERTKGTVEQAISQLRRILQNDTVEPQFIETVPGHGYRFVAQVLASAQSLSELGDTRSDDDRALDSPANGVSVATLRGTDARPWPSFRLGRVTAYWVAAVLLVSFATIGVVTHLHEPQIASATAAGNALSAKDAGGNILWTYKFDAPFADRPPEESIWRIQIVDLTHDGKPGVLVAAALGSPNGVQSREELFCFSSRGKLLWRYRPETHMEFNTRDLNGPWIFQGMLVVDDGKSKSIWLAVDHHIWWPSFLVKFSPDGDHEIKFASSGAMYSLMSVHTKAGTYVLAGGINNEYGMASVAVLAVDGAPASSPQSDGSKYQCVRGCPAGQPYRYILLPRSEVNATSDLPYNNASQMDIRPGGITIRTAEVGPTSQFFDFSEEFRPERVIYSSDYPEFHRRYETEGRISHSFTNCPEPRTPAVVRIFDENGVLSLVSVERVQ